jgi:hypothetical protein
MNTVEIGCSMLAQTWAWDLRSLVLSQKVNGFWTGGRLNL